MKHITIIGTEPPCPRCGLLTKVVKEKVKELNIDTNVEHWAYTDEKAQTFAKTLGLEPGTAKDVAIKLGNEIDKQKLYLITSNGCPCSSEEFQSYNEFKWSPKLDEFLRPYQEKANEVGILMTPVLIIDNQVKHSGSVPSLENIEQWLRKHG